jgi:CheY-like chemotaxis protein
MIEARAISGRTILIVDDNPVNLGVVVEHLEHRGFDVAVALGGEEALDRARFLRPNLILLDVMMPGIDGFETCRRLKAIPETRSIPVIFMTALGDVRDKTEGFAAGGADYVSKPFQVGDLLARVGAHIEIGATLARLEGEVAAVRAELDLARSGPGSRYRRLFDGGADGILLVDRADQTVIDANPSAAAMLGRRAEALIGRRLDALPGFGAAGAAALGKVVEAGHLDLGEWRIGSAGDAIAVALTAAVRRDPDGELVEITLRAIEERDAA